MKTASAPDRPGSPVEGASGDAAFSNSIFASFCAAGSGVLEATAARITRSSSLLGLPWMASMARTISVRLLNRFWRSAMALRITLPSAPETVAPASSPGRGVVRVASSYPSAPAA